MLISVLALFVGFHSNFWKAAPERFFDRFQRDSQSQVIGRLGHAQRDGLLADAALLGRLMPPKEGMSRSQWQYAVYERDLAAPEFEPYFSHPGGQGFILSLLDHVTGFSNESNFQLFQALAALFTALVLAVFLGWIRSEFGLAAFLVVLITTLAAQWLTVFGRNLYWFTGIFFLPMLVLCFGLRRHGGAGLLWITRNSMWPMLLKGLTTGFEFITTTTIMMMTPIVYSAVRDRWSPRQALASLTAAGIGAGIAVVLTLSVLLTQIAIVRGGIDAGIDHVAYALSKRSHGDPGAFEKDRLRESLEAKVSDVLATYLGGAAFTARGVADWLGTDLRIFGLKVRRIEISYLHLILVFAGCSILLLWLWWKGLAPEGRRRPDSEAVKAPALCAATWWALLAPLSWFVIFKSHSFLHPHVNFIAWHMPFTFFGMTLIGYCAAVLATRRAGFVRP